MKRPTEEEILEHYKTGIGENCLVCEKRLVGQWTDYNGQIKCLNCGMTYQILGGHLRDDFLAEHGLTNDDVARRYCDAFVLVPLYKAYWDETHNLIPEGIYLTRDRCPVRPEDFRNFYLWMLDHEDMVRPKYEDVFNFDAITGKYA